MTSVTDTGDMRVVVQVVYSDMQSMAMDAGAVYYYRVTIENNGTDPVHVLGRHWDFKTERDRVQIPRFGAGIIGEQPIIQPEEAVEYMSRIVLNYPLPGTMLGSFLCRNARTMEEFEIFVDE
jgi:ApaG protein